MEEAARMNRSVTKERIERNLVAQFRRDLAKKLACRALEDYEACVEESYRMAEEMQVSG